MKARPAQSVVFLVVFVTLALESSACGAGSNPDGHRYEEPSPYYLYLPQDYTPDRGWPLFIGVNGSSTEGWSCWQTWQPHADERGYVLLCPELADPDGRLHQLHGNERLLQVLGRVYGEYSLQAKIFLVGFSGGAQFVHGYAFMNPSYVIGVSVIATGNYYRPPQSTRHIPFVVIVGDRDNPASVENAKHLAWYLQETGYSVELHVLEGVGHTVSKEAVQITLDLYDRAVGSD